MLTHIHIRHFIIVKSLSLDFQNGLHVLTGETGAGKSIWIDAIEIGLGGRAEAHMIYPGEKTGDITLCFDLQHQPAAKAFLQHHDFPAEDECIIRRVIDQDKPTRTTLNGMPIPQQLVRAFAQHILCIHGQHQHQRLLKSDDQRELLDRYAGNDDVLSAIRDHFHQWKSHENSLIALKDSLKNKQSDLSLWRYQLDELEKLSPQKDEYDLLFSQYQQLHQEKKFSAALNEALFLLDQEEDASACSLTQLSLQALKNIPSSHGGIDNIRSLLQTATIHLNEARDALHHYCNQLTMDANQLQKIEERLEILQDVARKHHVDPTQLLDIQNSLREKINQLEKADDIIASLEKKQASIIIDYQVLAKSLTLKRQKIAKKLSQDITGYMQQLGMTGGEFYITLQSQPAVIHSEGNESVRFLIATNPGQTPHDLSDIVSGGELSRLSLIIQMLTAQQKKSPTLIFDEVDVGVGGKTADLIGKLLRQLSQHAQVLCVTHLPQVAAYGHHHFYAKKVTQDNQTSTSILLLTESERTEELARMLSGSHITEKSIQHARELLAVEE